MCWVLPLFRGIRASGRAKRSAASKKKTQRCESLKVLYDRDSIGGTAAITGVAPERTHSACCLMLQCSAAQRAILEPAQNFCAFCEVATLVGLGWCNAKDAHGVAVGAVEVESRPDYSTVRMIAPSSTNSYLPLPIQQRQISCQSPRPRPSEHQQNGLSPW